MLPFDAVPDIAIVEVIVTAAFVVDAAADEVGTAAFPICANNCWPSAVPVSEFKGPNFPPSALRDP